MSWAGYTQRGCMDNRCSVFERLRSGTTTMHRGSRAVGGNSQVKCYCTRDTKESQFWLYEPRRFVPFSADLGREQSAKLARKRRPVFTVRLGCDNEVSLSGERRPVPQNRVPFETTCIRTGEHDGWTLQKRNYLPRNLHSEDRRHSRPRLHLPSENTSTNCL